jgi:hypothetical protein
MTNFSTPKRGPKFQHQEYIQTIQVEQDTKDSWSYLWGSSNYTSSRFYHLTLQKFTASCSLSLDLEFKVLQQTQIVLLASAHG